MEEESGRQVRGIKWALITGASPGGLGEAEATAFLQRGINVIATSLETHGVEHVAAPPGSRDGFLIRMHLDVTSSRSIAATVRFVAEVTDGKIDFLINNAAYAYFMPLLDVDISRAKKQYDVNVWGLLAVTQAFFPLLRATKGIVVNQSSIAGLQGVGMPYTAIYASSKAAVISLSATMRFELAPFDVKVVTLITSAVKTEFYRNAVGGVLPRRSLYGPVEDDNDLFTGRALSQRKGHDRHEVARRTVDELLQEWPPLYITNGYMGALLFFCHWLLPTWLFDWIYSRDRGRECLNKLTPDRKVD